MNMYCNRSASSPNVSSFYCIPSSVARYYGSAMSVVMIHCLRPYNKEQWMVVVAEEDFVNHGRENNVKEWTGQSMSSLLRIADDRGRWAVSAADTSGEVPQPCMGVTGIS